MTGLALQAQFIQSAGAKPGQPATTPSAPSAGSGFAGIMDGLTQPPQGKDAPPSKPGGRNPFATSGLAGWLAFEGGTSDDGGTGPESDAQAATASAATAPDPSTMLAAVAALLGQTPQAGAIVPRAATPDSAARLAATGTVTTARGTTSSAPGAQAAAAPAILGGLVPADVGPAVQTSTTTDPAPVAADAVSPDVRPPAADTPSPVAAVATRVASGSPAAESGGEASPQATSPAAPGPVAAGADTASNAPGGTATPASDATVAATGATLGAPADPGATAPGSGMAPTARPKAAPRSPTPATGPQPGTFAVRAAGPDGKVKGSGKASPDDGDPAAVPLAPGAPPVTTGTAPIATPADAVPASPTQQVAAAIHTLATATTPGPASDAPAAASAATAPAATLAAKAKTGASVTIQLHPDDLGAVSVTMRMRGDTVDIRIEVANPQTLTLLEKDRQVLTAAVAAAGSARDTLTLAGGATTPQSGSGTSPDTAARGGDPWAQASANDRGSGGGQGGSGRSPSSPTREDDNAAARTDRPDRLDGGLYL